MRRKLLVATGMQKEARAARGPGIATVSSGGDSTRLRHLLAAHQPASYWGVVSFGIAGGLDPALRPGDVLVGTSVHHGDQNHDVCNDLSSALAATLRLRHGTVGSGAVAGSDSAVIAIDAKAALREQTGAIAVDMESHVVAEWARQHALPFAVLRVVSDPAHRALPPLAVNALKPNGRIDLPRVVMGLARRPGQLSALADAGRDSWRAFEALGRCGGLLGPLPGLGFAHF